MALLDFVQDYPGEPTPERYYQEGKTSLDLLEQEIVSGSGISWAICKSAPWPRHITMPVSHHSVFTGRMPFLLPNQQRQSTEVLSHIQQITTITHRPVSVRLAFVLLVLHLTPVFQVNLGWPVCCPVPVLWLLSYAREIVTLQMCSILGCDECSQKTHSLNWEFQLQNSWKCKRECKFHFNGLKPEVSPSCIESIEMVKTENIFSCAVCICW